MKHPLLAALATSSCLAGILTVSPDALAQRVINVAPEINAQNVSPDVSIAGEFEANGSVTVDPRSVRIFVNGENVTSRSTITRNFFTYRPSQPLPLGTVEVRVEYATTQGDRRVTNWNFQVQQPSPLEITSVTHNGTGSSLRSGSTLSVTMNGTPNASASMLLIEDGETVREIEADEVSRGRYVANLPVRSGDRVDEGIIVGRLENQGRTAYAIAAQPVAFNSTTPGPVTPPPLVEDDDDDLTGTTLQPEFTSHNDGDTISGSFVLTGKTRPNASVDVSITANTSVFGLVNLGGTILDRVVTANSNGEFEVRVSLPRFATSGTEYTVTAIASLEGETSTATELTLTQE